MSPEGLALPPDRRLWSLVASSMALLFLIAVDLGYAQGLVRPEVLTSCDKSYIVSSGDRESFCVTAEKPEWVWLKARQGTNFGPMANYCCVHSEQAIQHWRTREVPNAQMDVWYPIDIDDLKGEIAVGLGITRKTKPPGAADDRHANEKSPVSVPSPVSAEVSSENGAVARSWVEKILNENAKLVYWSFGLIILFAVVIALAVILPGIRTKRRTAQDKLLGLGNLAKQDGGQERERIDLETLQALAPLISGALAEALKETAAKTTSQKIVIDLSPPTANISEWVSFISIIKAELERGSSSSGGSNSPGVIRFNTDFGQGDPSLGGPKPGQGFPAQQVYVQRQIAYSEGSASFGGRAVFRETNDPGVSFCITVEGGGTGWLRPNPEARIYDSAYYQLFGISRNEEFPVRRAVEPQRVRLEGGQWVLASNS